MRIPFSSGWRQWLKYMGLTAAAIFLLFTAASWIIFRQRNELVLEQVQAELARSQSGQLYIGSMDLRLFRSFPDISIELDSVYYYERHDSLRAEDEQSILRAEEIYLALELWPLFNNEVAVSEISISRGKLNFIEYEPGVYNIHRALQKPKRASVPMAKDTLKRDKKALPKPKSSPPMKAPPTPSKPLTIELENLAFNDVSLAWLPLSVADRNHLLIRNLEADLSSSGNEVDIDLSSSYHIDTIQAGTLTLPSGEVRFDAKGTFDTNEKRLVVKKTVLNLDGFSFDASGTYDHDNNGALDVQVKAASDDLPFLERMLRQEVIKNNRDLLKSGDFFIDGKVWGPLRQEPLQFDFTFGVRNLSIRLPGNSEAFEGLGFEGSLTSGIAPDYSEAALYLRQIRGKVPGGSIDGDVRVSNLVSPWVQCNLQGQLNIEGLDKTFRVSSVQELGGTIAMKLRFDGPMRLPWPGNRGPKAKFDASFSASKLSFAVAGSKQRFSDITCAGTFNSGPNPDQSEAILAIPELKATIPGGQIMGGMKISNLNAPFLHYHLQADVDLEGYDEVLQLRTIRNLKGRAHADMRFDGQLALIGTHAMDSSRSSTFRFDSVSFEHIRSKRNFSYLQATLRNQNNLAEVALDLRCGDSDLQLRASIENLMHRLFSQERIVYAIGKVTSNQFQTKDFIFDSLQVPIVNDRISNFVMNFDLHNGLARDNSQMDQLDIEFDIRNLKAQFDQLPDIRELDTEGIFRVRPEGISLDLRQFYLLTPQGRADISGDMMLPGKRQLEARARLKLTNFPWPYISDLIDEIQDDAEPKHKILPTDFDYVTADLDLDGTLRTYPFDFHKLDIRNSRLQYFTSGKESIGASRIDATLRPFTFIHPAGSGEITGLKRINGNIGLKGLKLPGLSDINTTLKLDGFNDSLQVEFLSRSKASRDEGSIILNMVPELPTLKFHYEVAGTPAQDVVSKFSRKSFLTGYLGYTLDLATRGRNWDEAKQNMLGSVEIKSDSLLFHGLDMDDALTKFQKSQKFNLADLGAVVLVGPVGLVATKGTDFVALATINVDNRETTHISQLLAQWQLDGMILSTKDVAFTTKKNRVAINGTIDFENDSIPGVEVAVVDKNGCSLMDQKLHGKFSAIQTGKLNVAKTLLGSVINVVDALVGKDCKPVYNGQVKHPAKK